MFVPRGAGRYLVELARWSRVGSVGVSSWISARPLYSALRDSRGTEVDVFGEVFVPWLDEVGAAYRDLLEPVVMYGDWWPSEVATDGSEAYLSEELYALSRVIDVVLLGAQPSVDPARGQPWAHALHGADGWPTATHQQLTDLLAGIGAARIREPRFDPFLHEIVGVEQADRDDAPVEVLRELWPAFMLGELLLCRAGVVVRAGSEFLAHGAADMYPLYWTFLRRHRHTVDLSYGWGHNSQWNTAFRRDYRTRDYDYLNVDGRGSIEEPAHPEIFCYPEHAQEPTVLLTPAERRDLVRHRTLLRPPEYHLVWESSWEFQFDPFEWPLSIRREHA